jgi:hypothetical protein
MVDAAGCDVNALASKETHTTHGMVEWLQVAASYLKFPYKSAKSPVGVPNRPRNTRALQQQEVVV